MDQRAIHRTRKILSQVIGSPHTHHVIAPQDTCGIIAVVSKNENAVNSVFNGLTIMKQRGYDSAGVSTLDREGVIVTTKFASSGTTSDAFDHVKKSIDTGKHDGHTIGIGHTRWATHGGKTDQNAHPHTDMNNRVTLVHNGIIENADILRDQLISEGIVFVSETDTEVVVQLIGKYLHEGYPFLEATQKTLTILEGTWGLAIMDRLSPDKLIAAANGSPICIGIGRGSMYIASEPAAFGRQTNEFISLENGEVAVITPDSHSLESSRVRISDKQEFLLTPDPFDHWTMKEIMEQPLAVTRALNYGGRIVGDANAKLGGLDENIESLSTIKHLIIAACGTSYYAGLYGAMIMRHLGSFETVQVVDAAELISSNFPRSNAGLLVISQSGETKDVHRALVLGLEHQIPCFSVVNSVGSLIARTTHCGVYVNAGREMAVASTKAFTCQLTVLCLIATWFSNLNDSSLVRRKELIDSLHRLPTSVGMTLSVVQEQCAQVADKFKGVSTMFVLGKGLSLPVAMEGSLKIKEITYIHAEGYGGGSLKHGPFALIDDNTPIICIVLDDHTLRFMKTAVEEVVARDAPVILITNVRDLFPSKHSNLHTILIPSNGILTSVLAVLPLQILAYELAIRRGIDPDYPRNLAKAVVTD